MLTSTFLGAMEADCGQHPIVSHHRLIRSKLLSKQRIGLAGFEQRRRVPFAAKRSRCSGTSHRQRNGEQTVHDPCLSALLATQSWHIAAVLLLSAPSGHKHVNIFDWNAAGFF